MFQICCPLSYLKNTSPANQATIEIEPQPQPQPQSTNDDGFANNNGIIFSSMNSHGSNNQPAQITPINVPRPIDNLSQSSSDIVNNILDFNSHQSPFNEIPPHSHVQEVPQKQQSSFSGFTFAPLLIASSLSQTPLANFTNEMNFINQMISGLNPKPSSLPVPTTTKQTTTSTEALKSQCGISNYTSSRVVGGTITQIGQ